MTVTGYTRVQGESAWDDDARDLALEQLQYRRMIHSGCGNHASVALDPTVYRLVEHVELECLDCLAIEEGRAQHHLAHGHQGRVEDCGECADERFYVAERRPLPPEAQSTPRGA